MKPNPQYEAEREEGLRHRRSLIRGKIAEAVYRLHEIDLDRLLVLLRDRSDPYPAGDPVRVALDNFATASADLVHALGQQPAEDGLLPLPEGFGAENEVAGDDPQAVKSTLAK